ncbi:MAG: hypothetical protein ACHQU1_08480 [Gemmatimonadales bacterium]
MRAGLLLSFLWLLPRGAFAQASVVSDLWRIAAATEVLPMSLTEGGTAPLWTPAVSLGDHERLRVGAEAINSSSEIGVSGGLLAVSTRVPRVGVVSIGYGRLNVADISLTETSPEAIGTVAIYNQAVSIGVSRDIAPGVVGGVALRYLSGELGPTTRSQLGVDLGALFARGHFRLGGATRFFDPTLRVAAGAASYNLGAEYRSSPFDAWGARARVLLRYGLTASRGESAEHLVTAGVALGEMLALDAGASAEQASGDSVLRSRLAVAIGSGPFRIQIGRDGGVNGFGATYRFGLTGMFP